MVKWWSRSLYTEKKLAKARHTALFENQQTSLLQEFIDYENRPQAHRRLQLGTFISKSGEFVFRAEFEGERVHEFNLEGDVAFDFQTNPEPILLSLFDAEDYNERSEEYRRFMETEKELKELLKRILTGLVEQEQLVVKLENRAIGGAKRNLNEYEQLATDVFDMLEQKEPMLQDSPFFAERLYAHYRAFLAQRTVSTPEKPADPVEEDLVRILENEKLSEQTKEKARSLLNDYRAQKHEKDVEKIDSEEEEANLILSTIEQHYVKERKVS